MIHGVLISKGGAERTLLTLSHLLREKGHDVSIFVLAYDKFKTFSELTEGLNIMPIFKVKPKSLRESKSVIAKTLREFGIAYGMIKLSRMNFKSFDMVHAHNYPANNVAAMIRRRQDVPAIWGCNEPYRCIWKPWQDTKPTFLGRLEDISINRPLRRLDVELATWINKIYVVSEYMKNKVRALYKRSAQVIHPGVDLNEFNEKVKRDEIREKYDLQGKFVIVTAARLHPIKNVAAVIKAVAYATKTISKNKLIIIGEGPDKNRLIKLVDTYGLKENAIFTGEVSEISKYYAAADVFVFMPYDEPWGLAPVEAMACGVPVIVSNEGGPSESVIDGITGFHVSSNKPEEIASKLILLYHNEDKKFEMGKRAAKHAMNYSWDKMLKHVEGLYQSALLP